MTMKVLLTLAAVLTLSANTMFAGTIATDGSWEEFLFGGVGTFASGCLGRCGATTDPTSDQSVDSPWTFSGPATLQVVDLYVSGDEFAVYDNSVFLAYTSVPTSNGACGNDIGCALGDPTDYSHGAWLLGAGTHSITIQLEQSAFGSTGGAAVLSATGTEGAVPEPGTATLLICGLGILGFRFRRKA
jgi:hypothetical protein